MEEHVDSRRAAWSGDLEGELPWMQELACHLVRDREAARELVQDAWLQALQRPPRLRDRPRAWISTVMRNLVRQVGRRSARRGKCVAEGGELADAHAQPLHELERVELEALLHEELLRLEEPYRTTLRDHFVRGLTCAEIARRRGVPAGTVRWRLKTGLDRLRARLDDQFGREGWSSALFLLVPGARAPLRGGPGHRPAPFPRFERPALVGSLSLVGLGVLAGGTALRLAAPDLSVRTPVRLAEASTPEASSAAAAAGPELARHDPPSEPAPGPPSGPEPGGSGTRDALRLSVLVTDETGAPVAGARLEGLTTAGFVPRGTCDGDGRAELEFAPEDVGASSIPAARAHLALRASAPGHALSGVLFVPRTWSSDEPLRVEVDRSSFTLRGSVEDDQGRPLAGADVFVLRDPNHVSLADPSEPFVEALGHGTRTDEDGGFVLDGLGALDVVLCLRRPGSESQLLSLEGHEDEPRLRLGPRGTLDGRILDEEGQPERGAEVWLEPLHRGSEWCAGLPGYEPELLGFGLATTTDQEGFYRLEGVHPRLRRVYARSAADPGRVASALVTVAVGGTTSWDARLGRAPGIRLRLVDAEQEPLSGWIVQLSSPHSAGSRWRRRLLSDPGGCVAMLEAPGEADLAIYPPDGLAHPWLSKRVRVSEAEQTIQVEEGQLGRVFGRLLDANGQVPPGARLEACSLGLFTPAPIPVDPRNGRFRARMVDGEYALVLRSEHGGVMLRRIEVVEGELLRVGRLRPPELGELQLRADRHARSRDNYRLQICFGRTASKWREAPLPLLATEVLHAGLYRLDATGPHEGIGQSGWAWVRPRMVSELDLERLATVRVEVPVAPEEVSILLVVEATDETPSEDSPVRTVRVTRRIAGRFVHELKLPAGTWVISAEGESRTRSATVVVPSSGASRVELQVAASR